MTYEQLLDSADQEGLAVKEVPLSTHVGLDRDKVLQFCKDIPTQVKKPVSLPEELGHHYTSAGNILDQTEVENIKQERKARMWAYNKQIGLSGILSAYKYWMSELTRNGRASGCYRNIS